MSRSAGTHAYCLICLIFGSRLYSPRPPNSLRWLRMARPASRVEPAEPKVEPAVELLVITRDAELYERIRDIASPWKWTIREASEAPAIPVCFSQSTPIRIVVYDGDTIDGDWKDALTRIKLWDKQPCVLLASRVADPYLCDEVVRCGGYDVIAKSAAREQLVGTLRFAWFWKKWNSTGKS
jgi:DNA-binding NtrC family response regulator